MQKAILFIAVVLAYPGVSLAQWNCSGGVTYVAVAASTGATMTGPVVGGFLGGVQIGAMAGCFCTSCHAASSTRPNKSFPGNWSVKPGSIKPVLGTGRLAEEGNRMLIAASTFVNDRRLLVTYVTEYQAAQRAGNRKRSDDAKRLIDDHIRKWNTDKVAFQSAIRAFAEALPVEDVRISEADVLRFRDAVRARGIAALPEPEKEMLNAMHASDLEKAHVLAPILLVEQSPCGRKPMTPREIAIGVADQLDQEIDLHAYLPVDADGRAAPR